MSPTIYRDGPYRYFFFSREESRMHVHVISPDGEAKFWLEPEIELANQTGFRDAQVKSIAETVEEHKDEFISAWKQHFS